MASSWRDFALVFLGISLVIASALLFVAVRQYDHHCKVTGTVDRPNGQQEVMFYEELSPAGKSLFDRMVAHRNRAYVSPACQSFGGLLKYQGTYYETPYWRTFHWTAPKMLGDVGVFLGGVVLLGWVTKSRMRRTPW